MEKERIRLLIVEAINAVQATCGREIVDISDATVLTEDLDGFDSINAVETTAFLANALKAKGIEAEIPVDVFLTDGKHPSSLGFVLGEISRILGEYENGQ